MLQDALRLAGDGRTDTVTTNDANNDGTYGTEVGPLVRLFEALYAGKLLLHKLTKMLLGCFYRSAVTQPWLLSRSGCPLLPLLGTGRNNAPAQIQLGCQAVCPAQ